MQKIAFNSLTNCHEQRQLLHWGTLYQVSYEHNKFVLCMSSMSPHSIHVIITISIRIRTQTPLNAPSRFYTSTIIA